MTIFFVFSKLTHTRGHNYKLFKGCSRVNTHKYFFSNRVVEIWNALPSTVVGLLVLMFLSGCLIVWT